MDDASVEPKVMPLGLLREITNGFSEDRKLGSGSFGKVYEGVYQNGEKIAVKILYDMPGLDDEQFQNEFKHLARLRHPNIVRLVGFCHDIQEVQVPYEGKLVLAEKTHRALCLEFMSNGSLKNLLSDECERYDWHTCYRIIKGICQGLKYLHIDLEPPIYHLDLKPANILLDDNMVPRIADFGISRLFGDEQTWSTKSSLGTFGYLPPEFMRSHLVSNKFDIFSLGVVIIKMMAGRAGYFNIADMTFQEFTNIVQEKWTNRLLETSNRRNEYSEQVKICIQIGLSCVQEDRHQRPTILDIVYRLEESETKCTAAAVKDSPVDKDRREGDLVRVFADSESKITYGEGIPPLGEQQPTVLEVNEKRHPPELDDEVYRLEEISKDGTYHKRLQNAEIFTVKDLLKALNNDANKLRKDVLQMKKLNNSWEKMVKHARECLLADNHQLIAYFDEVANVVLFFNCVYDLVGAGFNGGYVAQNNFDAAQKALTNEFMELARNELDSTPFNYVMNGGLPVPVPSRENSFISMPVLAPDAVLQAASEYRRHDRIDHATDGIFSLGDACVHGDQNIAITDYFHGEGIPPLGHQQPSTSAVPYWDQSPRLMISSHGNAWDCNPLDWRFAGSSQVNNHSHAQADMSINGSRALEASTSSKHNLLLQQSFPTQFLENMPRMIYSDDVPNPVDEPSIWQDDLLPEQEPSANPFQGLGY